jgi:hypothetical protein
MKITLSIFNLILIISILKSNSLETNQKDKKDKKDVINSKETKQVKQEIPKTNTNNTQNTKVDIETNKPKRKTNTNTQKTKAFDNTQCGLLMQGPICIKNGNRVILPSATPKNLVGHWSFDKIKPLDESGNFNHAKNTVETGSSFGGIGYSAQFSQGNYLEVPNSSSFQGKDFTITFWFYLNKKEKEEGGMKICPLIQKGLDDLFNKNYIRYPGIHFDKKEYKFKIYVNTNTPGINVGESFFSNGKAVEERWTHISIMKKKNKLMIFLNGILDNKIELKGTGIENKGSFFIGGSPPYMDQCKFNFKIDELKYYNDSIDIDFLQAEASPALGSIEPNFLQLGCIDCDIKTAEVSCTEGYRLCYSVELHAGGYTIAKANGWINFETHIWTSSALKKKDEWKNVKGLGLCCAEIK